MVTLLTRYGYKDTENISGIGEMDHSLVPGGYAKQLVFSMTDITNSLSVFEFNSFEGKLTHRVA